MGGTGCQGPQGSLRSYKCALDARPGSADQVSVKAVPSEDGLHKGPSGPGEVVQPLALAQAPAQWGPGPLLPQLPFHAAQPLGGEALPLQGPSNSPALRGRKSSDHEGQLSGRIDTGQSDQVLQAGALICS